MSPNLDPRTIGAACLAAALLAALLVVLAGVPWRAGVIVWLVVWGIFVAIENPPRRPY